MIACISISNLLYESLLIPRHITQPILYALIAICGVYLYRKHYICYRYTLTDELLAIEEVGGKVEKTIAVIALEDIRAISAYEPGVKPSDRIIHASLPPRSAQTLVEASLDGKNINLTISASEEFVNKLTAQCNNCAESIR
ncbi:MAG: hypothetical protein R2912_04980 [Eubacteriales bacterium]